MSGRIVDRWISVVGQRAGSCRVRRGPAARQRASG
jgi:hypothetical protein